MGIQLGSLKPRQRALREGARRKTAGERVGAHRAAPRLEFESFKSLEFESLKPRELKSLNFQKLQTLKVRKVSNFGGLKL